jgi:hypothetical protein
MSQPKKQTMIKYIIAVAILLAGILASRADIAVPDTVGPDGWFISIPSLPLPGQILPPSSPPNFEASGGN